MKRVYRLIIAPALALGVLSGAAFAQDRPPATAMSMSMLTERIENTFANFGGFKQIEWDDDGYWDVEMWTTAGERVEARVDPVSALVTLR